MSQVLSVSEANLKGYNLSITVRDNGEDASIQEELAFRTIGAWLWIASRLEQNVYTIPDELRGSVESRYAAELNAAPKDTDAPPKPAFEFQETFGDSRVTIWDSYRGQKRINFHLNSDGDLQRAVDTWCATQNALDRAFEKWGDVESKVKNATQSNVAASNSSATPPVPMDTPATTKASNSPQGSSSENAFVGGVIVATRAPKSSEVQYADGQLVSFTVTKIVASANKGSPVYEMWTPLGSQWPTIKVYKLDTKGKEKPDYKAIVGILAALNLSLDKPEAAGTWRMIVKAAHVPSENGDREFLNVQSLTAI